MEADQFPTPDGTPPDMNGKHIAVLLLILVVGASLIAWIGSWA